MSDAEHHYPCLLASACPLWRSVYSGSLAHILIGLFVYLAFHFMSSVYILDVNPLLYVSLVNIFFQSVGCLFILLMVSFAVQKFLV